MRSKMNRREEDLSEFNRMMGRYGIFSSSPLYGWELDTLDMAARVESAGIKLDLSKISAIESRLNSDNVIKLQSLSRNARHNGVISTNVDQFSEISGSLMTYDYNFMDMPDIFLSLFKSNIANHRLIFVRYTSFLPTVLAYLSEEPEFIGAIKSGKSLSSVIGEVIAPDVRESEKLIIGTKFLSAYISGLPLNYLRIIFSAHGDIAERMQAFNRRFSKLAEFRTSLVGESRLSGNIFSYFGRRWGFSPDAVYNFEGTVFNYVIKSTANDIFKYMISAVERTSDIIIEMPACRGLLCAVPFGWSESLKLESSLRFNLGDVSIPVVITDI